MSCSAASVPAGRNQGPQRDLERHAEAQAWLDALRGEGRVREEAASRLHALLLRATRTELARRRAMLNGAPPEAVEDLAVQSADDALSAIMLKLDDFRFESRFTTWAYKFAILEAAVRTRRRAWQNREVSLDRDLWDAFPGSVMDPVSELSTREQLERLISTIRTELSPHQREVLGSLVLAEVPIDVLAERLGTTRGALYKTLHDARQKLRAAVGAEHA